MKDEVAVVFRALADPHRLALLERLDPNEPVSVGKLLEGLSMSRQGGRKHLQVLSEANIVLLEPKGREVMVRVNSDAITLSIKYLRAVEQSWARRLQRLKKLAEREDLQI